MTRILRWLACFFVGCPMEPWLIHALASDHEGVRWECPRCGSEMKIIGLVEREATSTVRPTLLLAGL